MSTAIDVYPTVNALPLVEEIRGRTQELFQTLLNRHGIGSTIEVIAFYPSPSKLPIKDVEKDTVWTPDLYLGFEYLIDGIWDSNSWHSCSFIEADDRYIVEELEDIVPPTRLSKILAQDHYWFDENDSDGPPVASTGYGLVCAALAEATEGIIASSDCESDEKYNAETAEEFLAWWGDRQIDFYGEDAFRNPRRKRYRLVFE
ncbi:hypothetical protein [Actinomyces sp. oral taxon 181]|jgi:hypothetical protein|uniref:hypothetical protein n=1 Tax=Actinomyces sp. oral taxon 181 TaxID=712121 RepID=UPI0002A20E86|nr:hypothetical protein [Actinomyces sp. oral taxon 181]EKY15058.1 hypothetical protein HMPREF9061_01090 [Actinomyces sp. oral taxon 181 str. F0379]